MQQYRYKKPRSINIVSILVVLFLAAIAYGGWKFGPIWFQAQEVDKALEDVRIEVANISAWTPQQRWVAEPKIQQKAITKIHDLGINDELEQPVEVWISSDYQYLQARYMVVVHHPFGKETRITLNRKVKIPATTGL
jgi:hypothetical protein